MGDMSLNFQQKGIIKSVEATVNVHSKAGKEDVKGKDALTQVAKDAGLDKPGVATETLTFKIGAKKYEVKDAQLNALRAVTGELGGKDLKIWAAILDGSVSKDDVRKMTEIAKHNSNDRVTDDFKFISYHK